MILWLLSDTEVSHFRWDVLAPWDLVNSKSHFSGLDGITWDLGIFFKFFWFFDRRLIFFRCKENFGYLVLMLLCFIIGGGLQRFFRMCYHMFLWIAIRIATHVIILLGEFCIASNTLLLLAHYYINYCIPYYTFSLK